MRLLPLALLLLACADEPDEVYTTTWTDLDDCAVTDGRFWVDADCLTLADRALCEDATTITLTWEVPGDRAGSVDCPVDPSTGAFECPEVGGVTWEGSYDRTVQLVYAEWDGEEVACVSSFEVRILAEPVTPAQDAAGSAGVGLALLVLLLFSPFMV